MRRLWKNKVNSSTSQANLREAGDKQSQLPATYFAMVSCLAYSSTLIKEAICSSETIVDFEQTTGISLKPELFITTSVRNCSPTNTVLFEHLLFNLY
jgi:hypothetical protein